jgi:hypothetical protein
VDTKFFSPYLLIALFALVPAAPARAENPPAAGSLEEALVDLPAARAGNEKATHRMFDRLKTLIRNGDADSRALVFYGCSTAMLARHTILIWKKASLARDGARLMDQAVNRTPDDPVVHLVRAAAYLSFPARLGKEPTLREDIGFLSRACDAGSMPEDYLQEAYRVFVRYYYKRNSPEERDRYLALIRNPEVKHELSNMIAGK